MMSTLKILMVDDDEADRDLIRTVLQHHMDDLEITEAPTLGRAREVLRRTTFDVLLVDYKLGAHSGLDVINEARSLNLHLPTIMLSGVEEEKLIIEAMQLGIDGYILKSFGEIRKLPDRIISLFEQKQLSDSSRTVNEVLDKPPEEFQAFFDHSNDMIQIFSPGGVLLYTNPAWCEAIGYTVEEARNKSQFELLDPACIEHYVQVFNRITQGDRPAHVSVGFLTKEGTLLQVEGICSCHFWNGAVQYVHGVFRPTRASREVDETGSFVNRLIAPFHRSAFGIVIRDKSGAVMESNEAGCRLFGYEHSEFLGTTCSKVLYAEDIDQSHALLEKLFSGQCDNLSYEKGFLHKRGHRIWCNGNITLVRDAEGMPSYAIGLLQDISERKLAEQQLRSSHRALSILNGCNGAIVHASSTAELATQTCRIITELGGHDFAWVGYVHEDEGKLIYPVAQAGLEQQMVLGRVTWEEEQSGQEPIAQAVASGQSVAIDDLTRDTVHVAALPGVLKTGLRSMLVLPLNAGGSAFGILAVYSRQPATFAAAERELLEQVAGNLAFGILSLHARAETKRAEESLRRSEQKYRILFDESPFIFITLDPQGRITSVNNFGADHLGRGAEELVGMPLWELYPPHCRADAKQNVRRAFANPDSVQHWELQLSGRDRTPLWVRQTARVVPTGAEAASLFLISEDVTELRHLSDQLAFQATHDALTGLINRAEFETRLQRLIAGTNEDSRHSLCYVDLDQFKIINDSCGHTGGDDLLRQLGRLLRHEVRSRDTIARLGGDEFAILMERCTLENAEQKCRQLAQKIAEFRFEWADRKFQISVSMGLVPINRMSGDMAGIMKKADAACYAAKDSGRNQIFVYHDDAQSKSERFGQMAWISQIHEALDQDRLRLYGQPIVPLALRTDDVRRFEVLLRMEQSGGELVSAGRFLPSAERFNVSEKIDIWVIERLLQTLESLSDSRLGKLHFSVNLSGQSLGNRNFIDFLIRRLAAQPRVGQRLCFEITETAAISNLANAVHCIQMLKKLGCSFALDDFGNGLSSFAYLKHLDVDYLKIDRIFLKDIDSSDSNLLLVRSIYEIGKSLGKLTVAEGVESEAGLEKLRAIGVDFAQGYAVGHPVPLEEVTAVPSNVVRLAS